MPKPNTGQLATPDFAQRSIEHPVLCYLLSFVFIDGPGTPINSILGPLLPGDANPGSRELEMKPSIWVAPVVLNLWDSIAA